MAQMSTQRKSDHTARDGGRWWSSRRLTAAIFTGAVLLLELLPLQATLLVLTAASSLPLSDEPISPLVNAVLLLVAWAIGVALRRTSAALAVVVAASCFLAGYALVLLTSPSAYAGSSNAAAALLGDLVNSAPRVYVDAGLVALVLFIGWRGFVAGSTLPSSSDVARRFKLGLGVVLLAVVGAALVPPAQRGPLLGALAIMLPVEVYVGLVASALARIQRERLRSDAAIAGGTEDTWLGMALGLSGVIVGGALALSLVLNYRNVGSLLARLGPLGNGFNAIASGIGTVVGLILYVLFNGLIQLLQGHGWSVKVPQSSGHSQPHCPPGTPIAKCMHLAQTSLDPFWLHAGILVLQIVTLVLVVVVALWLLRRLIGGRRRFTPAPAGVDEERESLDASSLLGAQLRALLANLRRPPPLRDQLTPGTTRYLYRGVLQAAAGAGIARAPSETPDEFAVRAAPGMPAARARGEQGAAHDMTALTEAYDSVRYAEREPEPAALGGLRAAARRVSDGLRRMRR